METRGWWIILRTASALEISDLVNHIHFNQTHSVALYSSQAHHQKILHLYLSYFSSYRAFTDTNHKTDYSENMQNRHCKPTLLHNIVIPMNNIIEKE